MKAFSSAICFTFIAASAMLAGCAGQPQPTTAADVMRGHASDAQEEADLRIELAENWDRGQELTESGQEKVDKGEKLLAEAERDLRDAQALIAEGRREVTEGTALVQESERRFQETFPGLELTADN
jgi:hypothetical protein